MKATITAVTTTVTAATIRKQKIIKIKTTNGKKFSTFAIHSKYNQSAAVAQTQREYK